MKYDRYESSIWWETLTQLTSTTTIKYVSNRNHYYRQGKCYSSLKKVNPECNDRFTSAYSRGRNRPRLFPELGQTMTTSTKLPQPRTTRFGNRGLAR